MKNSGQVTTRCNLGVRRAFTLVELLTVVVIITILMAVLAISLHHGLRTSKTAVAESLLKSIGMGIEAYKIDLGHEPPLVTPQVLGAGKQGLVTPETYFASGTSGAASVHEIGASQDVRFFSEYTIASYLLGIGDFNNDNSMGLNSAAKPASDPSATPQDLIEWLDDGQAGLGLKAPGRSRAWKSPNGDHEPTQTGRSFGPYLDGVSLGGDGRRQSKILELDEERGLYRIIDPWGNPVRYYRGWPTTDPVTRQRTVAQVPTPLRSWASVQAELDGGLPTDASVVSLTSDVLSAPYAVVCAGDYADNWVITNRYAPGNPVEPVAPFGDVVEAEGTGTGAVVPDSSALVGLNEVLKEPLERMLNSNLRFTP